jgi:hypothetical protein
MWDTRSPLSRMFLSLERHRQKNSLALKSSETNQTLKQPNKMKSPYRMMMMKTYRRGTKKRMLIAQ